MTEETGKDYLMEKKIEILIGMHTKKIKEEIDGLKGSLEVLKNQVGELKTRQSVAPAPLKEEPQQVQQTTEPKKEELNARTGDLKPGEINIDEYFYFGNKKR